jgi:hypothetical protein
MKNELAAGLQDSVNLPELLLRVVEVLDDHVGGHEIERLFGERQSRDVAPHASRHGRVMLQRLKIVVEADDQPTGVDELDFLVPAPRWQELMAAAEVQPRGLGLHVRFENILIEELRIS